MMDNVVAVSIIMPVYNSEKYLEECVESILAQEFEDFELLLIDDGSSDSSPALCDQLASRDKRVKVYHKENGGICAARNFGLERAVGEYIAFSDHDDYIEQGFIKDNYFAAKECKADIVKFGRKALIIRDDIIESTDIRVFPAQVLSSSDIKSLFLKLRFDGAMTCVWDGFFRRDFLNEYGLQFDTAYKKGGEDIDFCSKCFSNAETVILRDKVYYDHYIRIGFSTSTKRDDQRLLKFQNLVNNLELCIDQLKIDRNLNADLYLLNVVKEHVYPALIFFKNQKAKYKEVRTYLKPINEEKVKYRVSLNRLLGYSRKWGLFTWLFIMKQYRMMYLLLNFHKEK